MTVWTSSNRVVLRRARGAFDGPYPIFALMAGVGQQIPLSTEQVAALNEQALALAEMPDAEIQRLVVAMLDADHLGTEPPMDIAGFIRSQLPYDGSYVETSCNAPDSCDQCGRILGTVGYFFDACTTRNLLWSWMCPPCFFGLGCGVGEGWGQLFFRQQGVTFAIIGQQGPADHGSAESQIEIEARDRVFAASAHDWRLELVATNWLGYWVMEATIEGHEPFVVLINFDHLIAICQGMRACIDAADEPDLYPGATTMLQTVAVNLPTQGGDDGAITILSEWKGVPYLNINYYCSRKVGRERSPRMTQVLSLEDAKGLHDLFAKVYNAFPAKKTWTPRHTPIRQAAGILLARVEQC